MRSIRQWPPSVAGCFASGCECRLRDNPCCSCGRGEADGEEQWAGPMQRAAVTDTTTEAPKNAWSQARAMDLTPPPTTTPQPNPPHVPWCPGTERTRPSKKSCKPHWRSSRAGCLRCGLAWKRRLQRRQRERSTPPKAQRLLAWLRRAPQGRAPSGSGGKRRTLASWIRLASSLEETKRKGARWAAFYLHVKG